MQREKLPRGSPIQITLEQLKAEQARLDSERAVADTRLNMTAQQLDESRQLVRAAVKLAMSNGADYTQADNRTRRRYNQAFFHRVSVSDSSVVSHQLDPPFSLMGAPGWF